MKQLLFILFLIFSANEAFLAMNSFPLRTTSNFSNIGMQYSSSISDTLFFPINVPTIFTPNYDGVNDIFTLNTSGAQKVNCKIYNRWGVKVYEWEGIDGFWDGRTSAGLACPDGIYFYVVVITSENGTMHEAKGFTYLIR